MKRVNLFIIIASLIILFSFFVIARPTKFSTCPITPETNIVVYADTSFGGVTTLTKSWTTHFMNWWETQDPSINYVLLSASNVKSDCNLANYPNVKIYIQPGGNGYYQQKVLGTLGKNNILNFINRNGSYIGVCAGFYYAATDYYWQGSYYDWPDMLDIFPTVEGSITDIADYDSNQGYALTTLSNGHNAIYYGGPTQGWKNTAINIPSGGEIKSTYSSIPGDLPAIIRYNKMLLTSVHLEAFENDGINGLSTEQRIENYKLLANLINEAAETSFFVPNYAQPMQCADGIDNDADSLIDMNDAGCSSPSDNDETNSVNPGVLFEDDFEDSNMVGWTLSKVSGANNWVNANLNPASGTRHAQSQPMSTSEPASVMEVTLSSNGHSSVEIGYQRKLIGLDIADEFKASYYDGLNWIVLEQTGSGSANDASYLSKSYTLPSSGDIKIRFECTAGATSEYCRVDSVRILGL